MSYESNIPYGGITVAIIAGLIALGAGMFFLKEGWQQLIALSVMNNETF